MALDKKSLEIKGSEKWKTQKKRDVKKRGQKK